MKEKEFIQDSIQKQKAKKFLKENLSRAGIVHIDIRKTTLGHRITIYCEKPGLVIGKKGKTINRVKKDLQGKLGIEDVEIEVEEIERRNLYPKLVSRWIKSMLRRGQRPNRAIKRAINSVMDEGAIGAEITISGVITGANAICRTEKAAAGYLKRAGQETEKIREIQDSAVLPQGKIGISVKIAPPGVKFRDKEEMEIPEEIEVEVTEEEIDEEETEEKEDD